MGETLIDETRVWGTWADVLGIPRLTFAAGLGAALVRDQDYRFVFDVFGIADWRDRLPEVEARYGGFQPDDLYPDAIRCIEGLRAAGYGVAVAANQPASRSAELRALGVEPDVMVMSDELGLAKPDPAFFDRVLELLGRPVASDVAYVGDRVDNDVVAVRAMGLRSVWIRRGPWGWLRQPGPGECDLTVANLDELVDRIGEVWAG